MFEDMLKVYSGQAAIFSHFSLQKWYYHKFSHVHLILFIMHRTYVDV